MTKTVFISYSWDSEEHKDWVRKLADYLQSNGIEAILDQYELSVGRNMALFMESSIEKADKVLVILTPNYKLKSDSRKSGVGYEYSMITAELYEIQHDNNKFIPILREGDNDSSNPKFLKSFVYHDMKQDDRFESNAFELIRIIMDKPKIVKPKLGLLPEFEKEEKDPIIEIANSLVSQEKLELQKKMFLESREAADKTYFELDRLFREIQKKADEYREKTDLFFRAEYKQWRLVLISHGLCLNIYYKDSTPGFLDDVELVISIWDKPLSINNDLFYPPSEQPRELRAFKFKPQVNDKIEIVWKSIDEEITIEDLKVFAFEKLLEHVKIVKNLR